MTPTILMPAQIAHDACSGAKSESQIEGEIKDLLAELRHGYEREAADSARDAYDTILALRAAKPAYLSHDYVRLWDLVRYQRSELLAAGLITPAR